MLQCYNIECPEWEPLRKNKEIHNCKYWEINLRHDCGFLSENQLYNAKRYNALKKSKNLVVIFKEDIFNGASNFIGKKLDRLLDNEMEGK